MEDILIAAKVAHRHHTEAEWKGSTYVPADGEMIIYDEDDNYDYKRVKIGDGITRAKNLEFLSKKEFEKIQLEFTEANVGLNAELKRLEGNIPTRAAEIANNEIENRLISTLGDDTSKIASQKLVTVATAQIQEQLNSIRGGATDEITLHALQINKLNTNDYSEDKALLDNQLNTIEMIAKGAAQSMVYDNYQSMKDDLTNMGEEESNSYKIGDHIFVTELEVPDLWISQIHETSQNYNPTLEEGQLFNDKLIEDAKNGSLRVGYFSLSLLETQKVNLEPYATEEWINTKLDDYYSTTQINNLLEDYVPQESYNNRITTIESTLSGIDNSKVDNDQYEQTKTALEQSIQNNFDNINVLNDLIRKTKDKKVVSIKPSYNLEVPTYNINENRFELEKEDGTKIQAQGSAAIGNDNTVTAQYGLALGYRNQVKGVGTAALGGLNTISSTYYSVALGVGHSTNQVGQVAVGSYSTEPDANNIFVVGCGYSGQDQNNNTVITRRNALEIKWKTGDAYFVSDVYSKGKLLATKNYVDGQLENYALASELQNYVLSSKLDEYAPTSELDKYVLNSTLESTLKDYTKAKELDEYVKSSALNDYVKTGALDSYVKSSDLDNSVASKITSDSAIKIELDKFYQPLGTSSGISSLFITETQETGKFAFKGEENGDTLATLDLSGIYGDINELKALTNDLSYDSNQQNYSVSKLQVVQTLVVGDAAPESPNGNRLYAENIEVPNSILAEYVQAAELSYWDQEIQEYVDVKGQLDLLKEELETLRGDYDRLVSILDEALSLAAESE